MPKSMAQIKAIEKKNMERFLKANPKLNNGPGIYFLTRTDENSISYFYIGQAKHILSRLCSHAVGFQHIDLSLKKRDLWSADNPYGWKVNFINYPTTKLDEMEQYWILEYTKKGYQCRYNKTAGGQGAGKEKINEFRPQKGYRDGIRQGKKTLAKEISHIIDTHLEVRIRDGKQHNRISIAALEKFKTLIDEETYD